MPKSKKKILLDLDQTLISAEDWDKDEFKNHKDKALKFTYHDMDGYYIVFERPGLQEFLDFLFKNFTVSIWTAASKDYAMFIIDNIILPDSKPDRKLDWVFFSYHCDISKEKKSGTKDLRTLWDEFKLSGYTQDNTVILDDYDEVHRTQPSRCIIAHEFQFTDANSSEDNFLERLTKVLKSGNRLEEDSFVNFPANVINDELSKSKNKN